MPHDSPTRVPTPRELRTFTLTVGGAFVALAALLYLRGRGVGIAGVLATLGGLLAAAGLLVPRHLGPLYRAWMALALAISKVTTPVFMAVVYFGVLTPIGLVMRLAGRRPLARHREAATFWVERPVGERESDLRRQF